MTQKRFENANRIDSMMCTMCCIMCCGMPEMGRDRTLLLL